MEKRNKANFIFLLWILILGCSFTSGATPTALNDNARIKGFDSITFNAPGILEIVQGETEALEITGDPLIVSAIHAEVNKHKLEISTTFEIPTNASISYKLFVKNINSIILDNFSVIKIPALTAGELEMAINGPGRIQAGKLEAQNLTVMMNGAGSFSADSIFATSTVISSIGAGNISIAGGNTDTLKLNLESGSFLGEDFKSLSAAVTVNGTGTVFVWSVKKLNVTVNGAGRITYFGEPTMNMSMNGGGQIMGGGLK